MHEFLASEWAHPFYLFSRHLIGDVEQNRIPIESVRSSTFANFPRRMQPKGGATMEAFQEMETLDFQARFRILSSVSPIHFREEFFFDS
jgi:hypothetical protein